MACAVATPVTLLLVGYFTSLAPLIVYLISAGAGLGLGLLLWLLRPVNVFILGMKGGADTPLAHVFANT